MAIINLYNTDCMEFMRNVPDKHYDLAIVDPPYGIAASKGMWGCSNLGKITNYGKKDWDKEPPTQEYFDELKRVSKEQIIFGIEYVNWQGVGTGRIKWNKGVRLMAHNVSRL